MAYECLRYLSEDISWEAQQRDEKLSRLLTSPDVHQRFSALRLRLRESDAEELSRLQDAMESGAREAQRLAKEIERYESTTTAIREQQCRDRQSAEALAKILECGGERLAKIIESKGRVNQWLTLIIGAILGVIFQMIAERVF
jgi:septal ring factor EnvC (AmiA/AmiB activator)